MERNKRKQSSSCLQNVSSYFSQYCGATTVHAVQYLGEGRRFILEKLIWIILITIVSYFCIFLIMKSYSKWVTSPVIVSFGTEEIPISKIPFPAVTICPEVKTEPNIFNYTDVVIRIKKGVQHVTEDEIWLFGNMSLACENLVNYMGLKNFDKHTSVSPYLHLSAILPDHRNDFISNLEWLGNKQLLDDLSDTMTEYGICYNFNMLNYEDILNEFPEIYNNASLRIKKMNEWSLEGGYLSTSSSDEYPLRSHLSGINGGLSVLLFNKINSVDYLCGENPNGFKVMVHSPTDWPSMDRYFHVPFDHYVLIAIKPKFITMSEQLQSYSPADRKCYLMTERKLKYFKIYTQENCMTECLTNYTARACGCFPFYTPGILYDLEEFFSNSTTYCGIGSYDCIQRSKTQFQSAEEYDDTTHNQFKCNCLPSCTSLEYDVEISQAPWNWHKIFNTYKIVERRYNLSALESHYASHIIIYYKEMQFFNIQRNELYGYVDFFSAIGGLLGLFIGISVTSGLEILYFLTLRLACNVKMYGKQYWFGDKNLVNSDFSANRDI